MNCHALETQVRNYILCTHAGHLAGRIRSEYKMRISTIHHCRKSGIVLVCITYTTILRGHPSDRGPHARTIRFSEETIMASYLHTSSWFPGRVYYRCYSPARHILCVSTNRLKPWNWNIVICNPNSVSSKNNIHACSKEKNSYFFPLFQTSELGLSAINISTHVISVLIINILYSTKSRVNWFAKSAHSSLKSIVKSGIHPQCKILISHRPASYSDASNGCIICPRHSNKTI